MRYTLLRNLVLFLLAEGIVAHFVAVAPGPPKDESVLAVLKMEGSQYGPPFLAVESGGKRCYVVLDTGSSISMVDKGFFADLRPCNDEIKADTPGGQVTFQLYDPPDLNIGPCSLARCGHVVGTDLSSFSISAEKRTVAVLGLSAFRDFVVQLDYDAGVVWFKRHDKGSHADWGKAVEVEWIGEAPCVSAELGGHRVDLLIDTGGGTCDLSVPTPAFIGLASAAHLPQQIMSSFCASGVLTSVVMRMPTANVAGSKYRGMLVESTASSIGSIGSGFLVVGA